VDTKDWNAMAMGNGAIWVFTGLLNDLNDDEIAIIVGHELAHYTHEHSRKEFKRAMWGQLIALGAIVATEVATDNDKATAGVAIAGMVAAMTIRNGYSRNLEDQADRVGLRYAYEGGYDVRSGPQLWVKFREKYGEQNGLLNFFLGEHSQATDRIKKLEREIGYNYASAPRR
jgi:Zn-dependent protease with chaperone function